MDDSDDRVSELIAAAVAGELSTEEQRELDALRRDRPWIGDEIASLRGVVSRLDATDLRWIDSATERRSEASSESDLRDRIRAGIAADDIGVPADAEPRFPTPIPTAASAAPAARRHPRRLGAMLGAAACVGIGVGLGVLIPAALSAPPSGPPGTLGAVEPVDVRGEAAGTTIDADLVAHTWGTEAVVDATGLEVGATYSVVFVGADGDEFSAGEMLGSPVAIHCRVNAAVLREDVYRLEIRDESGDPVATADVPTV
nr:hypothetical protein [uncultured Microbacterium sp.]